MLLCSFASRWSSVGRYVALAIRLVLLVALVASAAQALQPSPGTNRRDSVVTRLRSGPIIVSPATTERFLESLRDAGGGGLHGLGLFQRRPTLSELRSLRARGLTLFSPLRHRVYRVHVAKAFEQTDSVVRSLLLGLALLTPRDRVAPDILTGSYKRYLVAGRGRDSVNYLLEPDSALRVTIAFYPGVSDNQITRLLNSLTRNVKRLSGVYWRAVVPRENLRILSTADIISWIDGPPPPLTLDNDNTRGAVRIDELQEFSVIDGKAMGLGGEGVQIGVFDEGIDEDHDDFKTFSAGVSVGNRVTLTDPAASWHGTMVAGVIAGNGTRSAGIDSWDVPNGTVSYRWRGIAPSSELLEVYFPSFSAWDVSLGTWTFDGELASQAIRNAIVDKKMDLSNHSYHFHDFPNYSRFSAQRDSMIRGDVSAGGIPFPPRLQVFSGGNNGGWPPETGVTVENNGYFSLNKDVKNGILVGSWSVLNNRVPGSSSLGPASDGRIKPDVVAPGSQIKSTGYWTPGTALLLCTGLPDGTQGSANARRQFYGTECGTSLAAPVVSGILALVLQQFAKTYGVDIDVEPPMPSTLRALIIHTADDIMGTEWFTSPPAVDGPVRTFAGPDFVTGYGLVNGSRAIDVTATWQLREGEIRATCETRTFAFNVVEDAGGSLPEVRVTLAWDDPAANPDEVSTEPRLVNDLDLVLIDPAGNRRYPWLRNHTVKNTDGTVLTPEQQTCATVIEVESILPLPGPITSSDLVAASTGSGPDHLNNVEQVVTAGVAGQWKAIVTGFKIDFGPQKFSLIGVPLQPFLSVRPNQICKAVPSFCQPFLFNLCQRYPALCARPQFIPVFAKGPRVIFRDRQDRALLNLKQLCTHLGVADRCAGNAIDASYEIIVGPARVPLGIELYSERGKKLAGTTTPRRSARIVLRPDRGGEYFLVLTPSAAVKPGTAYDVPTSVRVVRR